MSTLKTTAIQHLNSSSSSIYLDSNRNVGIANSSPGAKVHIAGANTAGGIGYADFLRVTNESGGTNPNKTFRLNSTGGIEIVNSDYSSIIFTLDNNGILATSPRGITSSSMPSGTILQVVNTIKTDTMTSGTSETWLDVTGMSATITPTSSTSKIHVHVCVGRFYGTNSVVWRVLRNGSLYLAGNAASNRQQVHAAESNQGRDANHTGQLLITYIDSPASTSSQTYQLQFRQEGTNFAFNRSGNDSDITNSYAARSSSSIILMEIAQ